MKITRTAGISIFLIIFLIAATTLGVMYNSENGKHKLAKSNLNAARLTQTALNKLKTDLTGQMAQAVAEVASWNNKVTLLQGQLAQANASLKQTQSIFPESVQTIEYTETITELAKASKLSVSFLAAVEPSKADLSNATFTFYDNVFTLKLTGKVSDMLDFIDKIAANTTFKTGAMSPFSFTIPAPLSQAAKDQMRADIKTKMVADKDTTITGVSRVALIEEALLTLLGEGSASPTVNGMTVRIHDIIASSVSIPAADLLSSAIASAINDGLADSLVDTIADIYSKAIAASFGAADIAKLLPIFSGPLGDEITDAIQRVAKDAIAPTIKALIVKTLNSMVAAKIAALVPDSSIDAALAVAVTAAEMPSAQFTIGVYSYKGG